LFSYYCNKIKFSDIAGTVSECTENHGNFCLRKIMITSISCWCFS